MYPILTPMRKAYRRSKRAVRNHIPWLRQPVPPGYGALHRWRSVQPIRRNFGWDTGGMCVDRYYIEKFLKKNRECIRGRVLEVADNHYTTRFGGKQVVKSDILHVTEGNPNATIVGDLVTGAGLPDNAFDCIILTQTLFCVYDVHAAIKTLHRILAPGGVLLNTEPGISQIARYDMDNWGDCWRFTSYSASRLFGDVFTPECVEVETQGNVLSSIAFLHGILATELSPAELDHYDPDYQMCVLVRARKGGAANRL